MSEVQARLLEYDPRFTTHVTDTVSEVVERQKAAGSYQDYFRSVGFEPQTNYDILDVRPTKDHDEDEALIVHLSMANPLDPNQQFLVASLADAMPNRRIIASSNPGGLGYGFGTISHSARKAVSRGDFGPATERVMRYAEDSGIARTVHAGASLGADLAVAGANLEATEPTKVIAVEPTSIVKRSLFELVQAFQSSEPALAEYVAINATPIFEQARKDSIGGKNYIFGLIGRLTNIAVARGIAGGKFEDSIDKLLGRTDSELYVTWGGDSELCDDDIATDMFMSDAGFLRGTYGYHENDDRVRRIEGGRHAMVNDIALHTAIILEAVAED